MIVGGGLAGLAAAKTLADAQASVLVLEASSNVGGRVQTGFSGGFRLDRGFQVFFTGYRTAAKMLSYKRLDLRPFAPGALVFDGRRLRVVSRNRPLATLFSPVMTLMDKLKLLQWSFRAEQLALLPADQDQTAEQFLRSFGFSDKALNNFFRPFLGGIFLDRSLSFSANQLNFVWAALARGKTVIPASGMAAIPAQLAQALPAGSIRLEAPVQAVESHRVVLQSGEVIEADAVIVATDAFHANDLLPGEVPKTCLEGWRGSTTLYFDAYEAPISDGLIALNASGRGRVNEVVCLPWEFFGVSGGESDLISVTLLGVPSEEEQAQLVDQVKYELASWFPQVDTWKFLGAIAIPLAQLAQAPGFQAHLAKTITQKTGVFLAGEITTNGSIDGALESGVMAANAVLDFWEAAS